MSEDKQKNVFSLHLKRNIILGVLVLVPLWLTMYFASIIVNLLTLLTYPLILALKININQYAMYITSFLLSLVVLYMIGILTNLWIGKTALNLINNAIKKIPIVGAFYKSITQLAETFNSKEQGTQKVVLINFPSNDMKTIGFIIKTTEDAHTKQTLACVFVPTTPNPTSGYLEIVPIEKTIALDWTFEEAMAFIISGGSSMPNKSLSIHHQ